MIFELQATKYCSSDTSTIICFPEIASSRWLELIIASWVLASSFLLSHGAVMKVPVVLHSSGINMLNHCDWEHLQGNQSNCSCYINEIYPKFLKCCRVKVWIAKKTIKCLLHAGSVNVKLLQHVQHWLWANCVLDTVTQTGKTAG